MDSGALAGLGIPVTLARLYVSGRRRASAAILITVLSITALVMAVFTAVFVLVVAERWGTSYWSWPHPGAAPRRRLKPRSPMSPTAFHATPARVRAAGAWASAGLVLGLLSGCTNGGSPSASSAAEAPAAAEASRALDQLKVSPADTMSDYDREAQFGEWIDADKDCEFTRDEVLNRDLTDVTSTEGCKVASGTLEDPYTGATINFTRGVATSSAVQIDHVVALGNGWVSGARNLSQSDRVAYANDPLNLLAVDGPTNGAKSDQPADQWLPPNEAFHCDYVAAQVAVKLKYTLAVTAPEKTAMAEVLSGCPDQQLPTGEAFGDIPGGKPAQ